MTKLFLTGLLLSLFFVGGACVVVPLYGPALGRPYEPPEEYISYRHHAHPITYGGYYRRPVSYRYYTRPVVIHRSCTSYGMNPITWNCGYPTGYTYWR